MQYSPQEQTKLGKSIQTKLNYIHSCLIKIGCSFIPTSTKNIEQSLNIYMQASDCRLQLIEWLIAVIYPGYTLDSDYKNTYDDDPHRHKVIRYKLILWQLGVMPMSKHTKNLDYEKYIDGLLGYESAVNLIYDLCELAQSKFSANIHKIEEKVSDMLGDLIKYKNQLVNANYDPYGVIFQAKYFQNQQDINKLNQSYSKLMQQMKDVRLEEDEQQFLQSNESALFEQMQSYKQLFARKYQKLSDSIESIIQKYSDIAPVVNTKEVAQLHNKRVVNISKSLCQNYRNYNKTIRQIRAQQLNTEIKQLTDQVTQLINGINQVHHIFQ